MRLSGVTDNDNKNGFLHHKHKNQVTLSLWLNTYFQGVSSPVLVFCCRTGSYNTFVDREDRDS